ncbi:MAG: hypothetical protein ACTHZ9_01205 [Leucobacter sp.]
MSNGELTPGRRFQIIAVSIFGAIAVITFLVAWLLDGGAAEALRMIAYVAAGICAVIGISFAFTGGTR